MNHHQLNIITWAWSRNAALVLCISTALLFAHGGFNHVVGTVAKLENGILAVKTAKGDVAVKLKDKTEITKDDQKLTTVDLKPGSRVVVDAPLGSKDMTAHSVKVGVSGASHAEHH
jgi:hypothetical protein